MNAKEKNLMKINLQAFANKNFSNEGFDANYEDKSYWALISMLRNIPEIRLIWDQDIASYGLTESLKGLYQKTPIIVTDNDVEEIIDQIEKTLKANIADHLIVCPIPRAQFKKKIKLGSFYLLPQGFTEKQKLNEFNKLVQKNIAVLQSDVEHTINSRSPDFLKYPLLCLHRTEQTSFIHYQSQNLARSFILALRVYYYSKIFNTKSDKTTIIVPFSTTSLKDASHLSIYAKDNWRSSHNPLNFVPNINFDISWLSKKQYREDFLSFYNDIYLKGNFDSFHLSFLNGMYLFSDIIGQSNSIQTILLMTICESILANSKNEKRLRTAALIPEFSLRNPKSKKEVSLLISELYRLRNNFVHSAEEVTIDYNIDFKEPDLLEYGKIITASLIVNYPALLKLLNQIGQGIKFENNESRTNLWYKHLDETFNNKVFRE